MRLTLIHLIFILGILLVGLAIYLNEQSQASRIIDYRSRRQPSRLTTILLGLGIVTRSFVYGVVGV